MMTGRFVLRLIGLSAAASMGLACGDLDLGDLTYFSDGFETGDLSRWDYDDGKMGGGSYTLAGGEFSVVSDPTSGHSRALMLELPSPPGVTQHAAVTRYGRFPDEVYVGFSVLWPARVTVNGHWRFLQFRGPRSQDTFPSDDVMWELGIVNGADGAMRVEVLMQPSGGPGQVVQIIPEPIVENRWTRFEMRTRLATDATGVVAFSMNGKEVFVANNVTTGLGDFYRVFFTSTGSDLQPAPARILIDDVTMSSVPWPVSARVR